MARSWVLSIAALALACVGASAQPQLPGTPAPEYRTIDFAWIREPWTGSSKPYAAIREEVGRLPKSKLGAAQEEAKLKAQRASRDARLQFRWAYITLRMQQGFAHDLMARKKALALPRLALAGAVSPHCYEFDRLRFLIEADCWFDDSLVALAKRLHAVGVKDTSFRYTRLKVLLWSARTLSALDPVLEEIRKLAAELPKDPNVQYLVGVGYSLRFPMSRAVEDAYRSIRERRRVLDMMGKTDPFRETLEFVIQAELSRLKSWGYPPPPKDGH